MVRVRKEAYLDSFYTIVLFPYHSPCVLLTFPSYIAAIAAAGSLLVMVNHHKKANMVKGRNGFGRVNVSK
jgi:hypothetical protein